MTTASGASCGAPAPVVRMSQAPRAELASAVASRIGYTGGRGIEQD